MTKRGSLNSNYHRQRLGLIFVLEGTMVQGSPAFSGMSKVPKVTKVKRKNGTRSGKQYYLISLFPCTSFWQCGGMRSANPSSHCHRSLCFIFGLYIDRYILLKKVLNNNDHICILRSEHDSQNGFFISKTLGTLDTLAHFYPPFLWRVRHL